MPYYTDSWHYYSENVPGYAEKYSIRGMRRRNAEILRRIRNGSDPAALMRDKALLAENNIPLARKVAEYYGHAFGWNADRIDDAFQDCCVSLTEFANRIGPAEAAEIQPGYLSFRLYLTMKSYIRAKLTREPPERTLPTIPFDEETHICPDEPSMDTEHLKAYVHTLFPGRNGQIFLDWYLGAPERYIEPGISDDISMSYNLTRERITQIVNKVKKGIHRKTISLERRGQIRIEDFLNY